MNKTQSNNIILNWHCTSLLYLAGITELDDFGDLPVVTNGKTAGSRPGGNKRDRNSSNVNQLETFGSNEFNNCNNNSRHTSHKSNLASPSPGKKKRDEGWKEVVRK